VNKQDFIVAFHSQFNAMKYIRKTDSSYDLNLWGIYLYNNNRK